ncbi:NAD(P)/FAD-dependent oxidoreductase [Stakelama sp. CBK3Z-3]|uniref:NAD(P)/FAD-dependent oxidoreductase n=1 Tax=Stakelama flava TaxID=2860338 RepID=A0ABS6XL55_9SPHN|nr:NAD(P)/FAD-dependent oxidoreductase [Stakelama flava]MBW4330538.1 NAD(P)/FAD-dependent oxidoreductase [Stakelama flava]
MIEHFDVVIVGAGISGIAAAYHLQKRCPDRSHVVLEARDTPGGTWDLFRYPGVRSDSDMHTLGFSFRPWSDQKSIADGPTILSYLTGTTRQFGIDRHIRLAHRVIAANWSSADAIWTVEVDTKGESRRFTCNFLFMCPGYYRYDRGYTPDFEGRDDFAGRIVHPQFWPADLDYSERRVVVIGSGATAVTLVPALAGPAAHVTMLQRSPTYIVSRPSRDRVANWLRKLLSEAAAHRLTRWKNVLFQQFFYQLARKQPERVKRRLIAMARRHLSDDYDVQTHFTPDYDPWDQRLCLVPDADLFSAIREGRASVVTGHIDRFTRTGIRLRSGEDLPADIIVTATGLELQLMSDIALSIDGKPVDASESFSYKGMMFSDIPNLALSFGYTNASWTLKAELTAIYVCRLLDTMAARAMRQCTPRVAGEVTELPFLDFTSGYVRRAQDKFPRRGATGPWRVNQNYLKDMLALRYGPVDDQMVFSNPGRWHDDQKKARKAPA